MTNMGNNNPLFHFEQLIQQNGVSELYDSFQEDCTMLDGSFLNQERTAFRYIERDEYGQYSIIIETFENKLQTSLNAAFNEAIQLISNQVQGSATDNDRKSGINNILDSVIFLYKHINTINSHGYAPLIRNSLKEIIKFIKEKYISIETLHQAYHLLDNNVDVVSNGNFGFKGRMNAMKRLFNIVMKLKLFIPETDESQFMCVFFFDRPEQLDIKLRFDCQLGEAAYILSKLQSYFHSLDDIDVYQSNCFLTRQGKSLKYGSFQTQRCTFKPNNEERVTEIDATFASFHL